MIWKGFKEHYEVNELGQVRNTRTMKVLTNRLRPDGYVDVKAGSNKRYLVHRLIATAFISNPDNKTQVNHINGIRHDFRLSNLEWVSGSENIRHSFKNGYS
jgi:hypothetical protein